MAFTIGAWAKAHNTPFLVGLGGGGSTQPPTQSYHYELADQTVTTPIPGQCPTGISWGRAVICQKTFTAGTGTVPRSTNSRWLPMRPLPRRYAPSALRLGCAPLIIRR